ncbi:reverse transcriptase-like protein, partial [Escherichia coli]|uniref:reverse transcriptase-like protein n=1 Tax=Escherichia coli TaxID=562 RepID=UPI00307A447E
MLGKYEAKSDRMKKYLEKAKSLQRTFSHFQIVRIPREQNSRADILSKLASSSTSPPVEEVQSRSINDAEDGAEVNIVSDEEPNWMTPIREYLEKGELPHDKLEARRIDQRHSESLPLQRMWRS